MTRNLELLFQESGDPGRVKTKANKSGKLKAGGRKKRARDSAAGVVSGSSEVMVKISGYGKGGAHAKAHLLYISRHAMAGKEKVALENESGQLFDNVDDVKQLFNDWMADIDANSKPGKENQRDTMHMILSMPGKANPDLLREAVRSFAAENFGHNHEYVFALHTDTDNDHCHLAVKCRGFDGRQLRVPKGQVQEWRQSFAERLRERGIDAEATPRNARGIVQKGKSQALIHIDNPQPQGRAPRQSRVMQSRLQEAQEAVQGVEARGGQGRDWEDRVRAAQGRVRATWLRAAHELETHPVSLKTKDGKDLENVRIDYRGIDLDRARAAQRIGAVVAGIQPGPERAQLHQSGGFDAGRRSAPGPVASVRDMPAGDVVRHQGRAEMLLRPDARNSLVSGRIAHLEVRRARAGLDSDAAARGLSLAERNQRLAQQIRNFVARMPEPVTAREALQRQLQAQAEAARQARQRSQVQAHGQDQAAPVIDHSRKVQDAQKDHGRSR